jgi:uncharacterized DUF497 family protein
MDGGSAMALRFRWDRTKAARNRHKHGITFETAARVFADPLAFSERGRIEGGEHRWQTIGSVEGVSVLVVAHTADDEYDGSEVINIISARRAGRSERLRDEKVKKYHRPRD